MNSVLSLTLLMLALFSLNAGMIWFAVTLVLILALVSLSESRAGPPDPNKRFFYNQSELPPIGSNQGEQSINASFMGDWDGLEDNYYYHDLVGSKIGEGLGKGFGFFK